MDLHHCYSPLSNHTKVKRFIRTKDGHIFTYPLISSFHADLKGISGPWHVAFLWLVIWLALLNCWYLNAAFKFELSFGRISLGHQQTFSFFDYVCIVWTFSLFDDLHSLIKLSLCEASCYFVSCHCRYCCKPNYRATQKLQ